MNKEFLLSFLQDKKLTTWQRIYYTVQNDEMDDDTLRQFACKVAREGWRHLWHFDCKFAIEQAESFANGARESHFALEAARIGAWNAKMDMQFAFNCTKYHIEAMSAAYICCLPVAKGAATEASQLKIIVSNEKKIEILTNLIKPTTMLFKTLKNDRKKVMVFRQPSKSGPNQYEFFIVVSEINHLGKFVINDNYKQK